MFSSSFHLDMMFFSFVQVVGDLYGYIEVWLEKDQVWTNREHRESENGRKRNKRQEFPAEERRHDAITAASRRYHL